MPSVKMMFKNAADIIESLTDNHKNPLHIGEAMACWTYYSFVSSALINVEVGLNTTNDSKLRKFFQDSYKVMKSHQNELNEFMRQEGVPLSDTPEAKPKSDPSAVPLGTKFTDNELANTININFVAAADMYAASASQSLRTDVAMMFLKFQTDKLSLGLKMKELMQTKGWLKVPPFYHPPGGSPTENKS
ncbi:DUF3231 family protein [Halobacillus hunanensis]|uniref:DUF3231 family protein n=1 Tax=Halobacillus hunanensis TaxID=578214 RepID=UPI0009A66188|nr:DUF3231 family protein [Halobacillus hunanensis]